MAGESSRGRYLSRRERSVTFLSVTGRRRRSSRRRILTRSIARSIGDAAAVALHTTELVAPAALVIQVIRGALGRARAHASDESGEQRDDDRHHARGFPFAFRPC